MATGTVKWFNLKKGYGFIVPSDGDKDIFVHISAVQDAGMNNLQDGQSLEYEVAVKQDKATAINLKPL
jgi:CspA family cold shock protein